LHRPSGPAHNSDGAAKVAGAHHVHSIVGTPRRTEAVIRRFGAFGTVTKQMDDVVDLEPYRGCWVARDRATSAVVASARDREALVVYIRCEGRQDGRVFLHQVPAADEPLFVGLG
jgi:hypothetical protein